MRSNCTNKNKTLTPICVFGAILLLGVKSGKVHTELGMLAGVRHGYWTSSDQDLYVV
jgi:hypothetical protein